MIAWALVLVGLVLGLVGAWTVGANGLWLAGLILAAVGVGVLIARDWRTL